MLCLGMRKDPEIRGEGWKIHSKVIKYYPKRVVNSSRGGKWSFFTTNEREIGLTGQWCTVESSGGFSKHFMGQRG